MPVIPSIVNRRARRALSEKPIPADVLGRILDAARIAESCSNNQPWRFVAVSKEPHLSAVKEHLAGGNYWARRSPCIVLAATRPEDDCRLDDGRDYALFDLGLATQNLVLQAVEEGLTAHPVAGFKPVGVKQAVGMPSEYVLITLVILGYPGATDGLSEKHLKQESSEQVRKDESETVAFNTWTFAARES